MGVERNLMRKTTAAVLVCLVLTINACGKSDPKTLLVGQWRENLHSEKWARNKQLMPDSPMPTEAMIYFFADGSGANKMVYDDPAQTWTRSFKWSLSEDGKMLKTESTDIGLRLARVVTLTKKELRIDEVSHVNGQFQRVEDR
jgi:hypothetical protein